MRPEARNPLAASPNREHRRRLLIEAAREVLLRDGFAACTARAIAAASPLTKSAIHYYFEDVEEIVDAAMLELSEAFFAHVAESTSEIADPEERFWAALRTYLQPFQEHRPVTVLWFEYWSDRARRGRTEVVERIHAGIQRLFGELLEEAGVSHAQTAAHAVVSWVLGTVLQQTVRPVSFEALRAELEPLFSRTGPVRASRVRSSSQTRGKPSRAVARESDGVLRSVPKT
ncbi:MAG: TetR family transcriptional regulator [Acidimicrobiales bacterium]|nr:MAG: TetR family transcriptional regulator [Acidimicrobiales bacterium]